MPSPSPGKPLQPRDRDLTPLAFGCVAAVVVMLVLVWLATAIPAFLAGQAAPAKNPFAVPAAVLRGRLHIGLAEAVIFVVLLLIVAGLVFLGVRYWLLRKKTIKGTSTWIDTAVPHMAHGSDLESLSEAAVTAKAERLRAFTAPGVVPGMPIGRDLTTGEMLYGSIEDLQLDIWGPRRGKSTSRVIPAICAAPGPVVTTSNKRDVLDATRLHRERQGVVWIFDPQRVANEPPTWWWNPLTWVTDDERAAKLADRFANSAAGDAAKKDPYFEPEGQGLLAAVILGCALNKDSIMRVYELVNDPLACRDLLPIFSAYGYESFHREMAGWINLTPKQRDGIFGTAKKMATVLRYKAIQPWVTDDGTGRPHFNPDEFVRSNDTLYSLSMEGPAAAGPLVTALTVAVIEAAEELGSRSPGGRLRTPMYVPLDECANVVRWTELPDKYSHFGSRGILVDTILQSYAQGVACWGAEGMKKLFGAANVILYGGGSKEQDMLNFLSELVGDFEYESRSVSVSSGRGGGSRSRSYQRQKERLLTSHDLGAMPPHRALVLSSGNRPTLIRTAPWFEGPFKEVIEESIARYEPTDQPELPASTLALPVGPNGYPTFEPMDQIINPEFEGEHHGWQN
ncbi:type IV secretory system conjugative DNA transfer family protein [Tsukamurella columbiensis]|uniref:Type IV secretory system conjugative DNA transfer family protein n=1 Tax=Tsukamurella columbiensis TaxID=128509 RepID=A0ABX1LKI7_9ACTN|nr:TraM recognition domain-containing protein [Tsukamurella columbiensis]NMD57985.1 type IV secretory system conjugative DNA transfer family protein [Tsukamurella columbiensis]